MKKSALTKLAFLGLSSGFLLANSLSAASVDGVAKASSTKSPNEGNANEGNLNYHLMEEDELLLELNPRGVSTYNALDAQSKLLARSVASQMCNGSNPCKGLNACETDKNECAGKGSCKGLGKCAFSDKNVAVKVVAEKMALKRAGAAKGK